MADSSSSQPILAIPYETFSFDLLLSECRAAATLGERFAPLFTPNYGCQLAFHQGGRRWMFNEQNVTGWMDREGVAGPDAGLLTVSLHSLICIGELFDGYHSVAVHIDHGKNTLIVRDGSIEFVVELPPQRPSAHDTDFPVSSSITVDSVNLAKLGYMMMTSPIMLPETDEVVHLPFVQFDFDGQILTAVRNWSHLEGPKLSVGITAVGDHRGEFSSFPGVIGRELYVLHDEEDVPVTMSFSEAHPNLMLVSTAAFSMRVELGWEQVFIHRGRLVSALVDDNLEVIDDDRIGWNPTIKVVLDDSVVEATITVGSDGLAHHLRLSSLVVKDCPWNLEVAAEINAWNDRWGNVKLVRHDGDLLAVCDIPIDAVESVPATTRDLVSKTSTIREVIGVFL